MDETLFNEVQYHDFFAARRPTVAAVVGKRCGKLVGVQAE